LTMLMDYLRIPEADRGKDDGGGVWARPAGTLQDKNQTVLSTGKPVDKCWFLRREAGQLPAMHQHRVWPEIDHQMQVMQVQDPSHRPWN
jgi:hypothetical protein